MFNLAAVNWLAPRQAPRADRRHYLRRMSAPPFVPPDFDVPSGLAGPGFTLVPLTPDRNPGDFAAWTSSMEHIHATPGFEGRPWPSAMTAEENLGDLEGHAEDFRLRRGFTYTVLEGDDEVIGCVYIYPADPPASGADVRSWVRADRSHLDAPLYESVSAWLRAEWPFASVRYAPRSTAPPA